MRRVYALFFVEDKADKENTRQYEYVILLKNILDFINKDTSTWKIRL